MKPVLMNCGSQEEACWMYVNLDRVIEIINVMDGANGEVEIEIEFPIDPEEVESGFEPGNANLVVYSGSVSEWEEYIASLPEMPYQPHQDGDWKNWCSARADGSIPHDEMYW
jgi:hypothetical protein